MGALSALVTIPGDLGLSLSATRAVASSRLPVGVALGLPVRLTDLVANGDV